MDAIVFLGIQGSGKGTQAKLLADKLGFTHINIGDLFRKHIKEGSELGKTVAEIIKNGDLVQDDLVFDLVDATITGKCKGLIFDGFPRTLAQAEFLLKHYHVIKVFYLDLSEKEAIRRIKSRLVCKNCGANFNMDNPQPLVEGICDHCHGELFSRPDDHPTAIHKRFTEFFRETYPLKHYFQKQHLLCSIKTDRPIEIILSDLMHELQHIE